MAKNRIITKKMIIGDILLIEVAGFSLVIAFIWLDEVFDLPHHWFNAPQTPINWVESVFETVIIAMLAAGIMYLTTKFLKRIRYLEGFLPVCSFCKRIRIKKEWIPIELYISDHSGAVFSHGLCPSCTRQHYGDIIPESDLEKLETTDTRVNSGEK